MEMEERSALTAGGGALLDAPAGVAACWADGCGDGFGIGAGMADVLSLAITSSVVDLQITPSRDLPNELPDLLVLVVFFCGILVLVVDYIAHPNCTNYQFLPS